MMARMPVAIPPSEPRTPDELRRHYEIECELARRLRDAPADERRRLYGEIYDEIVDRLPDQPMVRQSEDPAARDRSVGLQASLLEPFLDLRTRFLELGAGDASLAAALAPRVREAIVVEASQRLIDPAGSPASLSIVHGDATRIDLPDRSVDLAYSCHFLEHLHPEDAPTHLSEILRVLVPGGVYVVVTPNRIWGPHDISRYFDEEPRGLHLREYGYGDLGALLGEAGFARVAALRGVGRSPDPTSLLPHRIAETLASWLPPRVRRGLLERLFRGYPSPFRPLEQVKVAAWKADAGR